MLRRCRDRGAKGRASSMARLDGKVAAVSGGASGIGEATVRRFVKEGAKVAFADRDVERGKRVAAEIAASGGQVIFVEAHVQRDREEPDFVRQAAQRFGRLDILVNNAGVRLYHTVEDASSESWDEILGVNLKGYAFCAKAAIPLLRQTGAGAIVNVASARSATSIGKTTQYGTTKAAGDALTGGERAGWRRITPVTASGWTPSVAGRSTRRFMKTGIDRSAEPSSSTAMTPPGGRCSGATARRMKSPLASCFSPRTSPPT